MMHRLEAIWCFSLRSKWCCSTSLRNDAMFAPMCPQAHIIRIANIIRRSRHHLPKANIIQKTHLCLGRQKCVFYWWIRRESNSRPKITWYKFLRGQLIFWNSSHKRRLTGYYLSITLMLDWYEWNSQFKFTSALRSVLGRGRPKRNGWLISHSTAANYSRGSN